MVGLQRRKRKRVGRFDPVKSQGIPLASMVEKRGGGRDLDLLLRKETAVVTDEKI